jgi:glucosamine-6-phosphate deaminase
MNSKYALPKNGGLIEDEAIKDLTQRYERIATRVYESEYVGVQYIADNIVSAIKAHNEQRPFVLGLTTGKTPIGLYRELVKRYKAGLVSFANVAVYSLDEFYPINPTAKQSRNYRIHEELLDQIDIKPENINFPDGTIAREDVSDYCKNYCKEDIDLMIIGIGKDGQIGFNEPGSYAKSNTRLVQLSYITRKAQIDAFNGLENTPKMAITMGINTVMSAKHVILMAWSEDKAKIVKRIVEGDVSEQVPASCLQEHPNIEIVIDEGAASQLTRVETPWLVGS